MLDQSEGHKKEKDTLDKGSNSGFTEELDKEMNMDHQIWQAIYPQMPEEGLSLYSHLSASPHQRV